MMSTMTIVTDFFAEDPIIRFITAYKYPSIISIAKQNENRLRFFPEAALFGPIFA